MGRLGIRALKGDEPGGGTWRSEIRPGPTALFKISISSHDLLRMGDDG